MASPPGAVPENGEKPAEKVPQMGARVASFGALLVSNAPSHDDGQGGTEPHLYTTSAEGTFHSLQDAAEAKKMHHIAELLFYCSMGNLKAIKRLIQRESIDVSDALKSSDYDKRSPLHLAASDGSYAIADWLISMKAPVNVVDRFGFTPLESAIRGKHQELIKLIKSHGGKVMHNGELVAFEDSPLASTVSVPTTAEEEIDWEIERDEVKLGDVIGEGAFGTVHRAKWRGTFVAVKTLKKLKNQQENRVALAEFKTELQLIRHLHHPNVVQFLGVLQSEDGSPMLVQEFMSDGSLADWFKRPTGLSMVLSIRMCLDCARGMTYLHCRSPQPVIHRDLKPNNLMITGTKLKIGDFGLSKTLSVRNRLPQDMSQAYNLTGETGSYRYMAPEVFRHEYYGTPVDVYAFSMIAYQMFQGHPPFEGMSPVDAARAAAYERRRPILGPGLAPELVALLRDCWHPTPSSRPIFEEVTNRLEPLEAKFGGAAGGAGGGAAGASGGADQGCACVMQ